MKLNIIATVCMAVLFAACQKKDTTVADPAKVVITVTTPYEGQTFNRTDTVSIEASVVYATELHGYEVKITDTSSGFIVYDDAQHAHDDHFSIKDKWPVSTTKPTHLALEIIADIDHDGGTSGKKIYFSTN